MEGFDIGGMVVGWGRDVLVEERPAALKYPFQIIKFLFDNITLSLFLSLISDFF